MNNKDYIKIPEPTLRRLPVYLKFLKHVHTEGAAHISCTDIAREFQSDPTQVRKDLASTGVVGTARIGFDIKALIDAIEIFLGWRNKNEAFLVGVGNLGRALLEYKQFQEYGFTIVAAFDADPAKIGQCIGGTEILPVERLEALAWRMHIQIGIITVPASSAQAVAERCVQGGITGIWNFSPAVLKVPRTIVIEYVLLSTSLAVLTSKLHGQQKEAL